VCEEIDDDVIEELAMGRGRGTEAEKHVLECCECKERLRQSNEWITMFRQGFVGDQRWEEKELQMRRMQKTKSLVQHPIRLCFKRTG